MRYKAQYKPSDLLCPVTYQWTTLSEAVKKLNVAKFSQLVPVQFFIYSFHTQGTPDQPSKDQKEKLIEKIPMLYKQKVITLKVKAVSH